MPREPYGLSANWLEPCKRGDHSSCQASDAETAHQSDTGKFLSAQRDHHGGSVTGSERRLAMYNDTTGRGGRNRVVGGNNVARASRDHGVLKASKGMYHYTESGLNNVWLQNGFNIVQTPYGKGVSVDNVAGLHGAIAQRLLKTKPHWTGATVSSARNLICRRQHWPASLARMFSQLRDTRSVAACLKWRIDSSECSIESIRMAMRRSLRSLSG